MKFGYFTKESADTSGIREEIEFGEEVGFDAYWVNEHHVSEDNFLPVPLTRLMAGAALTDDVELISGIVIGPLHHPIHLAERAAMVDQLSEGRLKLGLALGYVKEDFDMFGIPMEERAGRLIEGLRLLDTHLRAEEPYDFDCPFWSVEDVKPIPPSFQDPRPPLWLGGWGDKALERSVKFADTWIPGWTANIDQIARRQEKVRRIAEAEGVDYESREKPLMQECLVADTHEEAMRLGRKYMSLAYTEEYGHEDWTHPFITREQAADFDKLMEDRFLVGTPNEVIEQIQKRIDHLDVDQVACRFHYPGMDHDMVMDQLERFGTEVIPSFD